MILDALDEDDDEDVENLLQKLIDKKKNTISILCESQLQNLEKDLNEEIGRMRDEIESLNSEIDNQKRENDQLKVKNVDLSREKSSLKDEIQTIRRELDESNEERDANIVDLEKLHGLETEVQNLKKSVVEVKQDNMDLSVENFELLENNKTLQKRWVELHTYTDQCITESAVLRAENKELQTENEVLKLKLKKYEEDPKK